MTPEITFGATPPVSHAATETAKSQFAPATDNERLVTVDMLRGAALLGILLMNIVDFGLPGAAYADPSVAGGDTGWNLAAWFTNQALFEGKMRALFSMLFGAGVLLLTGRAATRGASVEVADIYYRRTLWLIFFGLLHAYFIWGGDILYFYGVVGLMLYPLRKAPPKALLLAGLLLLTVNPVKFAFKGNELQAKRARAVEADRAAAAGQTLTDAQREAQRAWAEELKESKPDAQAIAREIADHRAGYWQLFMRRQARVARFESLFFYQFGFFDISGMMLVGMALMQMGVLTAQRSARSYALLALIGYGVGAPLNAYVGYWMLASRFDPVVLTYTLVPYDLGRLLVALGHIGLLMLIARAGWWRWLTTRLAAVGQMALTNYLTHSIVCSLLFNGYGFGLFARLQRYQLLYVVLGLWAFQLLASPLWLRHFRFGPMEWVWRSLTYWQRQPMRAATKAASLSPIPSLQ